MRWEGSVVKGIYPLRRFLGGSDQGAVFLSKYDTGKVTEILFILVAAMVVAVLALNLYTFYVQKNYEFSVELPCGADDVCFIRDCSDGECPPNELERYRLFALRASVFDSCQADSCQNLCEVEGSSQCSEVLCDAAAGDACTGGLPPATE